MYAGMCVCVLLGSCGCGPGMLLTIGVDTSVLVTLVC